MLTLNKPTFRSERVLRLACNLFNRPCATMQSANLDPKQMQLMSEPCIVVDENDVPIRKETKERCHRLTPEHPKGLLHRAFSVFLFNSKGELLLQRRSLEKITFPGHLTNTCCSHPLYTVSEMGEENAAGVKVAARRRLFLELGIAEHEMPIDCLHYITRVYYCAPSNDKWGEHEIDYILIAQRDVEVDPDPNEIASYHYVSKDELLHFIDEAGKKNIPLTPWFKLITTNSLFHWWDNLKSLHSVQNHSRIYRF